MHKRLIILSVIIAAALCGLTLLGYHAVERWAEGLEWKRLGEFAEVAEQIRKDVERKLDGFIKEEEDRPYTHYQNYYVPDNIAAGQQEVPVLVSPLSGQIGVENYLANGYFQIEPDGRILTANDDLLQREGVTNLNNVIYAQTQLTRQNIRRNLLPVLGGATSDSSGIDKDKQEQAPPKSKSRALKEAKFVDSKSQTQKTPTGKGSQIRRGAEYNRYLIDSLQRRGRAAQVIEQQRSQILTNAGVNTALTTQQSAPVRTTQAKLPTVSEKPEEEEVVIVAKQLPRDSMQLLRPQEDREAGQSRKMNEVVAAKGAPFPGSGAGTQVVQKADQTDLPRKKATGQDEILEDAYAYKRLTTEEGLHLGESSYAREDAQSSPVTARRLETVEAESEMVQVWQGPFETIVTGGGQAEESIFGKQVFLVRDVRIEDRRFQQGFQLNENRLIEEIKESAWRFMREGMSFELLQTEKEDAVYPATLDFAFGDLVLNLKETIPERIGKQVSQLQSWYFSIVAIVLVAVTLGLVSLWRYARAQMKLAEKKDDFISAVSHEFRTPLTSIRMYSEMLENKWVKSEEKLAEYYRNMRQESERLSRLIENVLDFSRIQKGRKKYTFSVGNLNECLAGVVEMMAPYAAQYGFSIRTELERLRQMTFDKDAVKQIVVNLLDNAIKYARNAEDKTITVRTKSDTQYTLIEVEDHGPGVPHRQRKKIFEEFYRSGSEATRETTGTGLGLALVKKFAQAHNGFVEILTAKPAGAIFRVALPTQS
ncbi:MAG: sensor histidine kinase [Planctomycetota bacterium]|jgi:signal transduction histidine kinase